MQNETQTFLSQHIDTLEANDIPTLQDVIRYHRELYYAKETPVISDTEFDQLFTLLVAGEEKYNIQDVTSPTQQVDHLVQSQFSKGDHRYAMKSLDNTYDAGDLGDFDGRVRKILTKAEITDDISYFVELKYDGLGVALTYSDGQLTRALTRGNGTTGEDITINIMQIPGIPKTIPTNEDREIRGEIIMPIAQFEELNKKRQKA